ncbi:hypothetical protein NAK51_001259 [Salmonella enterica]|nr:hypothetical protein [Salmonella enterica]EHW9861741.1 hypothetical protein [Salmonella enterica subsp. enterica serovar Poona]EBI1926297.1 hypothetical protein [Salmonella enterica]EHM1731998.1 hypothetical protein [Salmonella enterica]EHO1657995.1 hypothetical protein [Salmonella enterica]
MHKLLLIYLNAENWMMDESDLAARYSHLRNATRRALSFSLAGIVLVSIKSVSAHIVILRIKFTRPDAPGTLLIATSGVSASIPAQANK